MNTYRTIHLERFLIIRYLSMRENLNVCACDLEINSDPIWCKTKIYTRKEVENMVFRIRIRYKENCFFDFEELKEYFSDYNLDMYTSQDLIQIVPNNLKLKTLEFCKIHDIK